MRTRLLHFPACSIGAGRPQVGRVALFTPSKPGRPLLSMRPVVSPTRCSMLATFSSTSYPSLVGVFGLDAWHEKMHSICYCSVMMASYSTQKLRVNMLTFACHRTFARDCLVPEQVWSSEPVACHHWLSRLLLCTAAVALWHIPSVSFIRTRCRAAAAVSPAELPSKALARWRYAPHTGCTRLLAACDTQHKSCVGNRRCHPCAHINRGCWETVWQPSLEMHGASHSMNCSGTVSQQNRQMKS